MRAEKFLNLKDTAWEIATNNIDPLRRFKHVSLILKKNKIISIGTNNNKTHPLAKKYEYRFSEKHSELDALIKIPKELRSKLVLVNFRFNNAGQLKMSCPCSKCLPWCLEIFDDIYYSTQLGDFQNVCQ